MCSGTGTAWAATCSSASPSAARRTTGSSASRDTPSRPLAAGCAPDPPPLRPPGGRSATSPTNASIPRPRARRVPDPGQMIPPGQDLQRRPGNLAPTRASIRDRDDIAVAVQHQHRDRQAPHEIAHIDQPQGLDEDRRHGRAGRRPLERPGRLARLRAGQAGSHQIDEPLPDGAPPTGTAATAPPGDPDTRCRTRRGPAPGRGRRQRRRPRPAHRQTTRTVQPVMTSPRPSPRPRPAPAPASSASHRPDPTGRYHAVEPDQAAASLQRPHETAVLGLLPLDVQMRDQPRHHDQIRVRAGTPIGDLRPARSRVARFRPTAGHRLGLFYSQSAVGQRAEVDVVERGHHDVGARRGQEPGVIGVVRSRSPPCHRPWRPGRPPRRP